MATPTTLPATFVAGNVLTAAQLNNLRGAFRVLQCVSTTKTDTFSTSSTTMTDLTGMSVTITPSSTSSKIMIVANTNTAFTIDRLCLIQLVRTSTAIAVGDAAGSRTVCSSYAGSGFADAGGANFGSAQVIQFLDSPATTSATTYKLQIMINAAGTVNVNRSSSDTNSAAFPRNVSTITAYEISA